MKYGLLCLVICFAILGCGKKESQNTNQTCYLQCHEQSITPDLRGFSDSEAATIIARTYRPGSSFDILEDEKVFTAAVGNADSLNQHFSMHSHHDYIFILPAVDTFRVHAMVSTPTKEPCECNSKWCSYGYCFYYIQQVLVNDDTAHISTGQYNSMLLLNKN